MNRTTSPPTAWPAASGAGTVGPDRPLGPAPCAPRLHGTPPATDALVVDDHPLFQQALLHTLQGAGLGLQASAVGSAAEARHLLSRPGPPFALALVDQRLPDGEGLRLLAEMAPTVRHRVLITGQDEPGLAHQARRLGLSGFLPKTLPPPQLVAALGRVMAGGCWFPAGQPPAPPPLTERQLQVLRAVGRGCSNREIAERLGIGERTVKDYLSIVFLRLGAHNRAEAVAQATVLGLLSFDSAE